MNDLVDHFPVERNVCREQLVKNDAHCPDVALRSNGTCIRELFWRHVERRAHDGAAGGEGLGVDIEAFRYAKVEQLDAGFAVGLADQKDVRGLEVTMHDAERMRFGKRVACLKQDGSSIRNGQWATFFDDFGEVLALEVFHDHVGLAILELTDVLHLDHMVALEARADSRLTQKAIDGLATRSALGRKHHLDREQLTEACVPRGNDHAHATLSDDAFDAVFAEQDVAGSRRCCHEGVFYSQTRRVWEGQSAGHSGSRRNCGSLTVRAF